jgi:micrococcal nuclease
VTDATKASRKGLWADAAPTPPGEFRHPYKKAEKVAQVADSTCHVGPRGGHYQIVNGHNR